MGAPDKVVLGDGASTSTLPRVRVSAGVAEYDGGSLESWLNRADRALYHAKDTGRNRVVSSSEMS